MPVIQLKKAKIVIDTDDNGIETISSNLQKIMSDKDAKDIEYIVFNAHCEGKNVFSNGYKTTLDYVIGAIVD